MTPTLYLRDLLGVPAVDLIAVNQCSGNSRGFMLPRVPGAGGETEQWAMLVGLAFASRTFSIARE